MGKLIREAYEEPSIRLLVIMICWLWVMVFMVLVAYLPESRGGLWITTLILWGFAAILTFVEAYYDLKEKS